MSSLSKLLIITGLIFILLGTYFVFQRYSPKKLAFKNYISANTKIEGSYPEKIVIKKLNIELPIIPANINNKSWEATSQGVSFLASTPVPGQEGNSVLYGHNWESLLGSLPKLKPGDNIEIYLNNGKIRKFKVTYTQLVGPNDTSILAPSNDKRITLYTCAGFLDSKRFVATATLQD